MHPIAAFAIAAAALALAAGPAEARKRKRASSAAEIAQSGFDLASAAASAPARESRGFEHLSERQLAERRLALIMASERIRGPQWSYRAGERGPLLDAGALGTRIRGTPKLVHVVVDWDF